VVYNFSDLIMYKSFPSGCSTDALVSGVNPE
jgi:hypothetical protein